MAQKKVAANFPVGKYDPRERLEQLFECMPEMHAKAYNLTLEACEIIDSLPDDAQYRDLKIGFLNILIDHDKARTRMFKQVSSCREVMFNLSSFPQKKPSNPEQAPRCGRKPKDTPDTSWAENIEGVVQ